MSRRLLACVLAAVVSCAILLSPRFVGTQPHLRSFMAAFAPQLSALDIEATMAALTLDEKIKLLAGESEWQTTPIARLGIPSVRVSDGPNGIRGSLYFGGTAAACFPSSTAVGSTWDVELARAIGEAMGREARAKGVHLALAPTTNTARSPLGGRGFESFAEDPLLNGLMGAATVEGIQSTGVGATAKHFCCNDQETLRNSIDAVVDERTLREVYLKPFELIVKRAKPWAVMTGYNSVNGHHASAQTWLQQTILRGEWAFDGVTMSDWGGTYQTDKPIKAGLDIEMPGPTAVRTLAAVKGALARGRISPSDIDARVRSVLIFVNRAIASGVPFNAPERTIDSPEMFALLRRAAGESIVLLKNDAAVLPLDRASVGRVAVIGSNALMAAYSGGGSAQLQSLRKVTPLDGLRAALGSAAEIEVVSGVYGDRYAAEFGDLIRSPSGRSGHIRLQFFQPDRRTQVLREVETSEARIWLGDFESVPKSVEVIIEGVLQPVVSGRYEIGLACTGWAALQIDGEHMFEVSSLKTPGDLFWSSASLEKRAFVELVAGQTYKLRVEFRSPAALGDIGRGGIRLGGHRTVAPETGIADAVAAARRADTVICVVGLTADWEGEGFDRATMDLPAHVDDLVSSVLAANPRTVVVVQSGTPVALPWVEQAATVLQAWYGGGELGHGLADVLFGDVTPAARLSLSWPLHLNDTPTAQYGARAFPGVDGKAHYDERLSVGYRWYDLPSAPDPLFAFGHGLSYTSFSARTVGMLPKLIDADGSLSFSLEIRNTGSRPGRHVVQDRQASVDRPPRELKYFVKTAELAAGQAETLVVSLTRDAWAFWHPQRKRWLAESGKFDLSLGPSSALIPLGTVTLAREISWAD